ncbi:MAG: TlpA family protein disulfide reductase [Tenacibaculum sp.]
MKKLLSLIVFINSIASAQYLVKGTMTPPEKSNWVMLHKLQGIKPKYIANTTIKVDTIKVGADTKILGRFSFELASNALPGVYRITYRTKNAGFVDFIFNKENIELIFNPQYPEQSKVFTSSRENKLYSEYLDTYDKVQKKITKCQAEYIKNPLKELRRTYKKTLGELKNIQSEFEHKSQGMFANSLIKASQRFNSPKIIDNMAEYLSETADNFFKYIDFDDDILYNSSFLIDKVNDFVFYLNYSDDQFAQQKLYKKSIERVMSIVSKHKINKDVTEFLISSFTNKRNSEIVDWLFSQYYDKLSNKNNAFKQKHLDELSVSVSRVAPDFSWNEKGIELKLSELNDGANYLLVFWSTGCMHCVKEIPKVHELTKRFPAISVISFAIEDNKTEFDKFKDRLGRWHNAVGTHPTYKFDNEVVKKYKISATPTYFVLSQDKKIIAIPNSFEDLGKFLNKLKK